MTHTNGVHVGPDSPLRAIKRKLQPSEEDTQIALMELLVGKCRPGQPREPGAGMTGRYPELSLLYAIPNGGARSKRTAARLKAAGVLASIPDLHLPVARGAFLTLYVELKIHGTYGTPGQRAMAEALRAQGHCVVECQGVQEAVDVILGYLGLGMFDSGAETMRQEWRRHDHALLTPQRRMR